MNIFKGSRMLLSELFDEFITEQKVLKSAKTSSNYEWRLQRFIARYGNIRANKLKKVHLQKFLIDLRESGELSDSSINAQIQGVKFFCKWLKESGYIRDAVDYAIQRRTPKVTTKDVPTTANMFRLMLEHSYTYRDKLLITFVADTAARRGEVASVTLSNLRLDDLEATVFGKVGKRSVTFTEKTAEMIRRYIQHYRPNVKHDYLFCCVHAPYDPLSHKGVYAAFVAVGERIPEELRDGPYFPHSFRRWVAELYNANGDIYLAKQKLGHKKITTTIQYLQEDMSKVKKRDDDLSALNELDGD